MKLLIDIPDIVHDWLIWGFPDEEDKDKALEYVKNGTPIPDNATNKDVLQSVFPDKVYTSGRFCGWFGEEIRCDMGWLNAPYKDKE